MSRPTRKPTLRSVNDIDLFVELPKLQENLSPHVNDVSVYVHICLTQLRTNSRVFTSSVYPDQPAHRRSRDLALHYWSINHIRFEETSVK